MTIFIRYEFIMGGGMLLLVCASVAASAVLVRAHRRRDREPSGTRAPVVAREPRPS
jgi:hypothetical protein